MKKFALQCYLLLYAWISLSQLIALINTKSNVLLYYRTVMAFDPIGIFPYTWAILASVLAVISIWPLYANIHRLPQLAPNFFKIILALRVIADALGHNFETLFFRSIASDNPMVAIISLAIIFGLIFPSYKALYDHAFTK